MTLWVDILYYNLLMFSTFQEDVISVDSLVQVICFVLLFIYLLVDTCIIMYMFVHFVILMIFNICLLHAFLFVCLHIDHDGINA